MKKWASLFGAFILGVVMASNAGTVAAKVNSLIGKKVTAELSVVVNGKELADKGAVVEGRTNAPVRAIAEAIGGEVVLEGNKVTITTSKTTSSSTSDSKEDLLAKKEKLEAIINSLDADLKKAQDMHNQEATPGTDWAINSYEKGIADKQQELDKINEALKQFN